METIYHHGLLLPFQCHCLLWLQVASLELAAGAQPGGGAAAREFYEGKGRNKVMAKAKEAVSSSAIMGRIHFLIPSFGCGREDNGNIELSHGD